MCYVLCTVYLIINEMLINIDFAVFLGTLSMYFKNLISIDIIMFHGFLGT